MRTSAPEPASRSKADRRCRLVSRAAARSVGVIRPPIAIGTPDAMPGKRWRVTERLDHPRGSHDATSRRAPGPERLISERGGCPVRTHWNVCGVVLLGAGILGAMLAGCGKTRILKIVEPQPQQEPQPQPQVKDSVVSRVTLAVDPSTFSGVCPGYFLLTGSIAVTESALVVYRWERSDGYVGEPMLVDLAPGTSAVGTSWDSPPAGSHWMRLHVLLPNDIVSARVSFANRCVELA